MLVELLESQKGFWEWNPPWVKSINFLFRFDSCKFCLEEYTKEVEGRWYKEDKENKNKARWLGIFKIALFRIGLIWALKTWEPMIV